MTTSIICTACKALVDVVDRKIAEHYTDRGHCWASGLKYIPQGIRPRASAPRLEGLDIGVLQDVESGRTMPAMLAHYKVPNPSLN